MDEKTSVVRRKYLVILFLNAAVELAESSKADLDAGRFFSILSRHRAFIEHRCKMIWLAYFATEEEICGIVEEPDNPKTFPSLTDIERQIGVGSPSALSTPVNEEGTTYLKLLHQFTHGSIRPITMLSAGFKVEGIRKLVQQNTRDIKAGYCYAFGCLRGWSLEKLRDRLQTIRGDNDQDVLLKELRLSESELESVVKAPIGRSDE